MPINDILIADRVQSGVVAPSKKRVLEQAARLLARGLDNTDPAVVFEALLARERLGTTGIGEGVAIPHCRLAACTTATGALLKLAEPVAFDAFDGKPVDLVFALVVPAQATEEHLKLLAHLAALFNEAAFRDALRGERGGAAALLERALAFEQQAASS